MRHINQLSEEEFDLLVIGAGAFGAYAAWDAALKGLKVALVDRGDYGGGVSSRCFRMVHGGIRYLQHLDFGRLRKSCAERSAMLRTAPQHVEPLPIVIPTFGLGGTSRWFLGAGTLLYDVVTLDRNRHIASPERRIPLTRFLSTAETLDLFPFLEDSRPTGAVQFCDGHMHSPARLLLSVIRSAVDLGATVANYCTVTQLIITEGRARGAMVRDQVTGREFEIRAKCTVNAAGPGAGPLLAQSGITSGQTTGPFSRDACLVVDRPSPPRAIAVQGQTRDLDAVVGRGKRHLFMVPWKGKTLIGVWHRVYHDPTEDIEISRDEVEEWLREVNASCPGMNLKIEDVLSWDYGLVPFGKSDPQSKDLHFGHESRFLDHQRLDGISNLLSVIGIRYTMGRGDGERVVNWALRSLMRTVPRSTSHTTPVRGGDISDFSGLEKEIHARAAKLGVSDRSLALLKDHGTDYEEVLAYIEADPSLAKRCGDSPLTAAEVVHAVRHEAVLTLEDLVLRRTDLGVTGCPGDAALYACAEILAKELHWTAEDIEREIEQVRRFYPEFRAPPQ